MKSPSGAPGIPAGTIPVAATDEPGSSSDARRFQSTAIANAWRTFGLSNGASRVSKP